MRYVVLWLKLGGYCSFCPTCLPRYLPSHRTRSFSTLYYLLLYVSLMTVHSLEPDVTGRNWVLVHPMTMEIPEDGVAPVMQSNWDTVRAVHLSTDA